MSNLWAWAFSPVGHDLFTFLLYDSILYYTIRLYTIRLYFVFLSIISPSLLDMYGFPGRLKP